MNVLLISANTLNTPYPVYPMGLDYVAAALLDKHRVKIVDMNLNDLDSLGRIIEEFAPDVIGISLRNIDNTDTSTPQGFLAGYKKLVDAVRKHSKAIIVLGGSGFSILPEQFMSTLKADYGIVGEGERMATLLDALEKGEPTEVLPGVITSSGMLTAPSPLSNALPRHFDPTSDHLHFYLKKGGMLNLQTKRGCPFRCIYCTYPHIEGRRFRLVAPEKVAHTAKELQEAGAKYLFIADSAFNADTNHSLAVAAQFKKIGITIPWGAFLAPMKMPTHYYETLKAAGLTHAEFGTESLSNRVLNSYGKPFDREQAMNSHKTAVQAGLHVAHYFLFGGPGETIDTLNTTLTYLDKLEKSVLFLFCGMRIYPHTDLFRHAVTEGQITQSQDLLKPIFYQSSAIGSDEIIERVKTKRGDRVNWIIGSGEKENGLILARMYERGYTGPLWEFLIR
jgi:radical SAM superfamily enzyme YgiQ (UPF0313 family)